jgi:predicted HAD superfamily Cof-like phosphohydrolase
MKRPKYIAQDSVRDFHVRNGQVVNEEPEVTVTSACTLLRIRLIQEETAELIIAIHNGNDLVEIADGLADLKYVMYGSAVSYGLSMPDLFPEEKDLEPIGGKNLSDESKALMCSRLAWISGRIAQTLWTGRDRCEGILHDVDPWVHREELFNVLTELDEEICSIAAGYGIPIELVFARVHEANMTKRLSGTAGQGGKYGEGDSAKGEGFQPADIATVLYGRLEKDKTSTV